MTFTVLLTLHVLVCEPLLKVHLISCDLICRLQVRRAVSAIAESTYLRGLTLVLPTLQLLHLQLCQVSICQLRVTGFLSVNDVTLEKC